MSAATPAAMLIDSNEEVRDLMRAKLESGGIEVLAERAHGIAAQQAIQDLAPELIFVAIEQPIQRAMQVVEFGRAAAPDALIVAYANSWSPTVERRLMQAGVNDFLHGKVTRDQVKAIATRARHKVRSSGTAFATPSHHLELYCHQWATKRFFFDSTGEFFFNVAD